MRTMKSLVAMGLPVRPSIMRSVMTLGASLDGAGTAPQRAGKRAKAARVREMERGFMPLKNSLRRLPSGVGLAVGTCLGGTRMDIIHARVGLIEGVKRVARIRDPCGVAIGHGVLGDFLEVSLLHKFV